MVLFVTVLILTIFAGVVEVATLGAGRATGSYGSTSCAVDDKKNVETAMHEVPRVPRLRPALSWQCTGL